MVQHELNPPEQKAAPKRDDRDVARLEEELADILGAQVKIKAGAKGAGQLAIHFSSLDQLDGILERLR
jgi:ParB family chromosome partitioning protein